MVVIHRIISKVNLKGEKGFSLVGLITVMVIITILVAIAVTILSDVSEKPANEVNYANERNIISTMHMALFDHGAEAFIYEIIILYGLKIILTIIIFPAGLDNFRTGQLFLNSQNTVVIMSSTWIFLAHL